MFNRLAADRIHVKLPCVVLTGRGVPDLATRYLLHRLASKIHVPVLGLFDYNPHGIGVMLTYMQGSASMVRGSRLSCQRVAGVVLTLQHQGLESFQYAVPMRWIGLVRSDVELLASDETLPMTARDLRTIENMLAWPFFCVRMLLARLRESTQRPDQTLRLATAKGERAVPQRAAADATAWKEGRDRVTACQGQRLSAHVRESEDPPSRLYLRHTKCERRWCCRGSRQ